MPSKVKARFNPRLSVCSQNRAATASRIAQLASLRAHRGAWYAMVLVLSMLGSAGTGAQEGDGENLREEVVEASPGDALDWVPIADLPEARRDLRCRLCGGA